MKRVVLLVVIALAVAGTAGVIGYYYYRGQQPRADTSTTQQHSTPTQAGNTTESPTDTTGQTNTAPSNPAPNTALPSPAPITYPVQVYFSKHPESDNSPSRVFPVTRISPDLGVGRFAITQLLQGPTASEQQAGYFATARLRDGTSSCSGDFTLSIQSGVATLQFCKTFAHIGVISDGQADSELKATLLQFSSIQKVIILNKAGDCEFNLSGLNLCKQ